MNEEQSLGILEDQATAIARVERVWKALEELLLSNLLSCADRSRIERFLAHNSLPRPKATGGD